MMATIYQPYIWLLMCAVEASMLGYQGTGFRNSNQDVLHEVCPDYTRYARLRHPPYSDGPLGLPFQRPDEQCRQFTSPAVEKVITDLYPRFIDRDLAHIFQNAFPNTLDTTVLWHVDGDKTHAPTSRLTREEGKWRGAQSFIVTGDINAMWLRDSTGQTAPYQPLAKNDPEIFALLLGQIATQAEYIIESPYCNAFQPPAPSGLHPTANGQEDYVQPTYEPSFVFECKYELDSLASFLAVSNKFYASTGSTKFMTETWLEALAIVLRVLDQQSRPTFNPETHEYQGNKYIFMRITNAGTETLNLRGMGNPLASGTGLVRSAFRPSDDASIYGFLVPSNAMMSVELGRAAKMIRTTKEKGPLGEDYQRVADNLEKRSNIIHDGIYKHAVVDHARFGKVFAYEVDGYGSTLFMDDANVPSLLSLPHLGFIDRDDEIYKNTRKMILSSEGNPYFLNGSKFSGIGGPHIGLQHAWPMSVLVQALTSNNPEEILECLNRVKNISVLGLINESVDVEKGVRYNGDGMTRSWFAWANGVFAETILWVAQEYPELLFGQGATKYVIGQGMK